MKLKERFLRIVGCLLILFTSIVTSQAQGCYSNEFKKSIRFCDEGEPDLCAFGTAIWGRLYKDIECLFAKGASPNPKYPVDRASSLPTVIAAQFADEKVLQLFAKHNVDWEAKDTKEGMTALLWINSYTWREPEKIRGSYYETSKFLLENGANVNVQDTEGHTVLMNKASLGKLDFVNLFLVHKAAPNLQNKVGQTALMLADFDPNVISALIKAGANVNMRDNQGRTAVFYAADKCFMSKLNQLVQAGAKLNLVDNNGITPLILAHHADPRRNCADVIKLLSRNNIEVSIKRMPSRSLL